MGLQLVGAIEVRCEHDWVELVDVGALLFRHCDLHGCLFGVDNTAQFAPLFADRGLPSDCSQALQERLQTYGDEFYSPSWFKWSELKAVDWDEVALGRDERISEFLEVDGNERYETKSLALPGLEWIREALDDQPEASVRVGRRTFRRLLLKRKDALTDTEFPVLMDLMACLAARFGDEGVRMTVGFA